MITRKHFNAHFLGVDYCKDGGNFSICDILTGRTCAYARRKGSSIIDWGAIGFIAEKSGGYMCDYDGNRITDQFNNEMFRAESLIVAASEEIAIRIINSLK